MKKILILVLVLCALLGCQSLPEKVTARLCSVVAIVTTRDAIVYRYDAEKGMVPEVIEVPTLTAGTVITEDGYVLSCAHGRGRVKAIYCLEEVKSGIITRGIREMAGHEVFAWEDGDVALYKIDEEGDFVPVPMATRYAQPGDEVMSIGHPLGLVWYPSWGKVSNCLWFEWGLGVIVHGCSVNKGNSGGPLLNVRGEIVGVNVSMLNVVPLMDGSYVPMTDTAIAVSVPELREALLAIIATDRRFAAIAAEFEELKRLVGDE